MSVGLRKNRFSEIVNNNNNNNNNENNNSTTTTTTTTTATTATTAHIRTPRPPVRLTRRRVAAFRLVAAIIIIPIFQCAPRAHDSGGHERASSERASVPAESIGRPAQSVTVLRYTEKKSVLPAACCCAEEEEVGAGQSSRLTDCRRTTSHLINSNSCPAPLLIKE